MSRFYIKEISASGEGKRLSTISFEDGVNIIYGASNSGKSYIIGCINFMYGGDIPFEKAATGYDTISMRLESIDGHSVSATRKIVDGSKGDTGANSVQVITSLKDFENGDYSISKLEYSDLLLYLMGIKDRHKIISTQAIKTQNLTNRTFFHMFFIDEDNVFRKGTALDVPKHSKITASLSALKFLIDGDDMHELVPEETEEERKLRIAKNNAVVIYINKKIQQLTHRHGELEKSLEDNNVEDIEFKMENIIEEITSVEGEIVRATEASRKLLEEVYTVSAKLEEATFLKSRHKALRTQYSSDIKRLKFIVDGDSKKSANRKPIVCPFCDGDIPEHEEKQKAYMETYAAELQRINYQLEDLTETERDIDMQISTLEVKLENLNTQNDTITELINRELRPKASELHGSLAAYKRALQIQNEMVAMESIASAMGSDVIDLDLDDEATKKFDPRTKINDELWKIWSDDFELAVKACAYPNAISAYISKDTADAVVNGKHKKNEGKGYRAFLNTILTFTLMKFLEQYGTYKPSMLVLDSPILSLKEKVKESEHATAGMKESLFKFIIENCGQNQLIIAENEIPTSPIVDYSKVNMIEFTLDENEGRYGFLRDFRDIKTK